ncbi:hypothetical protein GMO_10040 [Gluconobacter morbifer G707]|uniref:Uncharacterized protein n=1 Tax=Gluconobacter morbifer G707 TaxID=1088869 RepID=G6XHN8_9PROT|nr:hypothetical protein GMO_10040 [Gluconobacter morbifer G707]
MVRSENPQFWQMTISLFGRIGEDAYGTVAGIRIQGSLGGTIMKGAGHGA